MSPRVLIIDAEADFASQLSDTLQSAGVDTAVAADGKVGLDMAKAAVPAAIVVCVELPRMSGYSVCTKLRKDEALKAVPVIITSSGATPETFESHSRLSTRANEYLKKPFPPAMLLDVLRPYLGAPLGEPEAIDGEEIDIVDDDGFGRPATLSDEEAFSQEEARSMDYDTGAKTGVTGVPNDSDVLARAAVAAEDIDEAEALTTIGNLEDLSSQRPPPLRSTTQMGGERRVERLKADVIRLEERLAEVERQRDDALAHQAEAVSRSSLPSTVPGSRELLDLKRERNAKEKEIIVLKETLNQKERELISWRDKETELEDEIVRLQEQAQQLDAARSLAEAKAAEQHKTAQATISDLKRRLSESNSREADLDGTVQALQAEMDTMREHLAERERTEQQLRTDLENTQAELAATRAELDEERSTLAQTADALKRADQQVGQTSRELDRIRQELGQAQSAYQRTAEELQETAAELERTGTELAQRTEEANASRQEIDRLSNELDGAIREGERLSQELGDRTAEVHRLTNELSAATAEAHGLRDKLRQKSEESEQLAGRIEELEQQAEVDRQDREGLRGLIEEMNAERDRAEQHLTGAYQRLRDEENVRNKALQALEIASALLKEAGYAAAEAGEVDQARS
jgi:CheY-like chemotaxis protein